MLWKIEQVKEGIKVTFDPGLLFGHDSARLTEQAEESIRSLVRILAWCQDSDILVEPRTDSISGTESNHNLTRKRLAVVANFARELGLKALQSAPSIGTTAERFDSPTSNPGNRLQSNE